MKKALFTWLILFLTSPLICVAQEVYTTDYEVQYEVEFSKLKDNLNNKKTEVLYLYTSPQASVFVNESVDSDQTGNWASFFQLKVYKNFDNGKVIATENLASKIYGYQEPDVPLDWNITSGSKNYFGYQAQKATTSFAGRDYEAWFTMEIPLPDGPYVFSGLPGLIVELYDTQKHYHFSLLSVEKLEEPKDWELGKVEEVSKEEFREIRAKVMENRNKSNPFLSQNPDAIVEIRDADGREISQAEFLRNRRKSRESKNNPIELE